MPPKLLFNLFTSDIIPYNINKAKTNIIIKYTYFVLIFPELVVKCKYNIKTIGKAYLITIYLAEIILKTKTIKIKAVPTKTSILSFPFL